MARQSLNSFLSGSGDILFFPMRPKHIYTAYLVNATPYNFSRIFLKLCRCFCQGLKMFMAFGCSPQIFFCYIFRSFNIVFFARLLTKAYIHLVSCECNSSHNFSRILLKLCRCFCQGLRMCMTFAVILRLIFVSFCSLNLARPSTKAYRHWVSCERNFSYNFSKIFF